MTDKALRRLGRRELLELLTAQSREIDSLKEALEKEKENAKEREFAVNKAGSIAEASLALSGIFEAAQNAADLYVRETERLRFRIGQECQPERDRILEEARREAAAILAEAENTKKSILQEASAYIKDAPQRAE